MADQKEKAKEKKNQEDDDNNEQASGHGKSGGNMGAGQSGKEDMGSEKPTDGSGMASHKPNNPDSEKR